MELFYREGTELRQAEEEERLRQELELQRSQVYTSQQIHDLYDAGILHDDDPESSSFDLAYMGTFNDDGLSGASVHASTSR